MKHQTREIPSMQQRGAPVLASAIPKSSTPPPRKFCIRWRVHCREGHPVAVRLAAWRPLPVR